MSQCQNLLSYYAIVLGTIITQAIVLWTHVLIADFVRWNTVLARSLAWFWRVFAGWLLLRPWLYARRFNSSNWLARTLTIHESAFRSLSTVQIGAVSLVQTPDINWKGKWGIPHEINEVMETLSECMIQSSQLTSSGSVWSPASSPNLSESSLTRRVAVSGFASAQPSTVRAHYALTLTAHNPPN